MGTDENAEKIHELTPVILNNDTKVSNEKMEDLLKPITDSLRIFTQKNDCSLFSSFSRYTTGANSRSTKYPVSKEINRS